MIHRKPYYIYKAKLKRAITSYMQKVSGIEEHCKRCLNTERWRGSVVLMVVDTAFTSIGLNYFTAVVPKVEEFNKKFVENGRIKNLEDFEKVPINELRKVWKNKRSWQMAGEIASYLSNSSENDKLALTKWAKNTTLESWDKDPIGRINGVGINTFQYLWMMGGIDTVMPDKIVKRVINEILEKADSEPINDDIEFVKKVEEISYECGYRPIELCWMTWLIQPEGKIMRMKKYSNILSQI